MNFVARAKISFKFNESSLFFNRKVIIKIDPHHHHHQKYPAGRVRYNRWKWGNTLYRRGSKQKRKIENRRCVVRLGRGFREYGAFVAVEIFESDVSFDVPTLPSPSSLPPPVPLHSETSSRFLLRLSLYFTTLPTSTSLPVFSPHFPSRGRLGTGEEGTSNILKTLAVWLTGPYPSRGTEGMGLHPCTIFVSIFLLLFLSFGETRGSFRDDLFWRINEWNISNSIHDLWCLRFEHVEELYVFLWIIDRKVFEFKKKQIFNQHMIL